MKTYQLNGRAMRAIRERSGLSVIDVRSALLEQQEIAVHPDHLRNLELGYRQPSERLLVGIAACLRVPVAALLMGPPSRVIATAPKQVAA